MSNQAHLQLVDDLIELPDGSTARRVDDTLELCDSRGRLVIRFRDGMAELTVPEGDLTLRAPTGAVRIEAASDLEIAAGRDIVQRAARNQILASGDSELRLEPRRTRLKSRLLEVTAQKSQLATGIGRLLATHVQASAESIVTRVKRHEVEAERLVERTHSTLREVSDLLQTKSGRVRSFVDGVYAMYSGRTVMVSEDDTSIDGKKVLLG